MLFWKLRHETLDIIAAEMLSALTVRDRQLGEKDALNASNRCVKKEEQRQENGKQGTVGKCPKIRRLPDYDSLPSSQSLGRNSHISVSTQPLNVAWWLKNVRMLSGRLKPGQSSLKSSEYTIRKKDNL